MPDQPWENRKQDDRIAKDADQAESVAIQYGNCNLESGTYDDRIADALDDYDVPDPLGVPRWASEDIKFDSAVSEIALEVQRRRKLLQTRYPFKLRGNQLVYTRSKTLVYEFCLAVSLAPSLKEGEFVRLPRAFEFLVRDVLICFLGEGSQGFRTGWPGDKFEERPTKFKDLVAFLHKETGEFHWHPDPGLPADPSHKDVKEEGVDVICWKSVLDLRPGKLFLLCQCACGDDWVAKFNDIDPALAKLTRWMKPVCWAWPMRVFTIPRHIPNDSYFGQVNREAGLTLDRIRLTLVAEQKKNLAFIRKGITKEYPTLIALVIKDFKAE
jgi:hypothetical protein